MSKKILLTPGPLTTHEDVRHAMMDDYGSRDDDFIKMVRDIRPDLTKIALEHEGHEEHEEHEGNDYPTTLLQGSGTFALEAMMASFISPASAHRLLILTNGAYGDRLELIAQSLALPHDTMRQDEGEPLSPEMLDHYLLQQKAITHIVFVHGETSTGMLNPLPAIAAIAKKHDKKLMVDAMSSFAIHPLEMAKHSVSCLVASSNKGLESVAGISFVISHRLFLEEKRSPPSSLVLNLCAQNEELEKSGQFRFTPPVQVVAALHVALKRLEQEGGRQERFRRYNNLCDQLRQGMSQLGFEPYLASHLQSPMIVAFLYPDIAFDFDDFYQFLKQRGFLIYRGKSKKANSFRVGCIGAITSRDMDNFLHAVKDYRPRNA